MPGRLNYPVTGDRGDTMTFLHWLATLNIYQLGAWFTFVYRSLLHEAVRVSYSVNCNPFRGCVTHLYVNGRLVK